MMHLVAYDVSDNGARARLAALLCKHGVRLQRSVFECDLDETGLETVLEAARTLLDLRRESLQVDALCGACRARRHTLGQAPVDLDARYWLV